tara:strand:- start:673 stop:879 length:207 start_codon:yes stop_codon:yes gene_type:complete
MLLSSIVQNLYNKKATPFIPTLSCIKKIGVEENNFIDIAMTSIIGNKIITPKKEKIISNNLLINLHTL